MNVEATIELAYPEDATEILELQRLAYQSEASIYDDYSIPPLTQSLPEIEADFKNHVYLKAVHNGKIVGSVRGRNDGETCYIGRLIVDPDLQNQGLGTRLLNEIEHAFPEVKRFELFTGERSKRNLYFYEKAGYKQFRREAISEKTALVFLEKRAAE